LCKSYRCGTSIRPSKLGSRFIDLKMSKSRRKTLCHSEIENFLNDLNEIEPLICGVGTDTIAQISSNDEMDKKVSARKRRTTMSFTANQFKENHENIVTNSHRQEVFSTISSDSIISANNNSRNK